jgi:hypothetical protein
MHPTNPSTIYAGYNEVYKSTDRGDNWTTIGPSTIGGGIIALTIAPSDPNYIYTASLDRLYMTSNGGTTWSNVTSGLPVSSTGITCIAVSDQNPQQVWVTLSGYQAGQKVLYSSDAGSTWTNISGSLPNIPVNCIAYQNGSNDALYIGTDFGVYYIDNTLPGWIPYGNGLPNVIISELEIFYPGQKIRAATYGRGIWEADLSPVSQLALDAGVSQILEPNGMICDNAITPLIVIRNNGVDPITDLTVSYRLDAGSLQSFAWSGTLAGGDTIQLTLPMISVTTGTHALFVRTSDPNGQADQYPGNDSFTRNFTVSTTVAAVPQAEGFEAFSIPADWTLDNASGVLSYVPGAGGFGLSSIGLKAGYFDIVAGATATIELPHLDFSAVTLPVYLDFNVAYAVYDPTYHDSLKVLVSTDCGQSFDVVYAKGDNSLATAPATQASFMPDPSQWRAERVDLSSYAGNANVLVRFVFPSGYGNNLYVDDINLYDNSSSVQEDQDIAAGLFPNPTSSEVTFSFRIPESGDYRLDITDLSGRILRSYLELSAAELQAFRTDLSAEASGLYFYRLYRNGAMKSTGRIVKY